MMSKISLGLSLLLLLAGCSASEGTPEPVDMEETETESDAGSSASAEPQCFENPRTHFEIINACTDSVKIKKTPNLKLLNEDGTLPSQ